MPARINSILLTFYIVLSGSIPAGHFWLFVSTFQSADEKIISERFPTYIAELQYYILPAIPITFFAGLILRFITCDRLPVDQQSLRKYFLLFSGYCLFIIIDLLLFHQNMHFRVYELIGIFIAMASVFVTGFILSNSGYPELRHPTTIGMLTVAAMINGICCFLIFSDLARDDLFEPVWIFILLILSASILFARFRYLSMSGSLSNRAARRLLGKYIFLFGARIILGICIPLVFITYTFITGFNELQGISILILLGNIIDIYLLVGNIEITAETK